MPFSTIMYQHTTEYKYLYKITQVGISETNHYCVLSQILHLQNGWQQKWVDSR